MIIFKSANPPTGALQEQVQGFLPTQMQVLLLVKWQDFCQDSRGPSSSN